MLLLVLPELAAQPAPAAAPSASVRTVSASAPAQPDNNNANKENGNKEGDKKEEGSEGDKKDEKSDGPAPVKREAPTEQPNPINTEVKWADNQNAVQFSFHNQPWKTVLQWIADASKLSLHWQELPGDALDLTTTRAYTLEEARDLLNRLLLSRGYTMLLHGEMLEIVKTAELKSSLVPRVKPEQLEDIPDHSIVKVSFNLDWLIAEEAATELQPMLTDAGRISKLSQTNRLEVIDTAVSLREIWHILKAEQSDAGQEQLMKTFHIQHRRASDVITMLRMLLGLQSPMTGTPAQGMDPRMVQQMMQMQQQMMQKMMQQAQQNKGGGNGARKERKTRLVLNTRENSILAHADPDQMAIIDKAVAEIDVKADPRDSMLQNMKRWKVYRLETLNPQTLVDLLQELGDLDPGTILKVDKDKNAILAWAAIADQLTITTLVERLDTSGRELDVIHLRRLDAEYVAGTIMALMGPKKKDEDNNSRYRYFYSYRSQNEDKKETREFRVEAVLQDNSLLIYANPVEMGEIRHLLMKLGEIPDPDARDGGYRVFELNPGDDPESIKKQLQQLWRRGNDLEFNLPPAKEDPPKEAEEDVEQDNTAARKTSATATLVAFPDDVADESRGGPATSPDNSILDEFLNRTEDEPQPDQPTRRPPVKISVSPDGRLIVASDDPVALAEFEELLQRVAKPAPKYKVFKLQYQTPMWVTFNLEEYFESEDDEETYLDWWGYPRGEKKDKDPTLGNRRIPQFIYDNYTSTILVRNADRRQLQTIEELIKIYDVPQPSDTRAQRIVRFFHLKNAQAAIVSQAIKDVFRDLLSASDKALEKPGGQQQQQSVSRFSSFMNSRKKDDEEDERLEFKGLLSIGIDAGSNTLVISSTSLLMDTIEEMVNQLDQAAEKSSGVRIIQLDASVDLGLIQEKLGRILGTGTNAQTSNGQPNPNGQQNQNGKGNRGQQSQVVQPGNG